ncbi:hypothetical protein DFH29DRAFT_880523 [Suillus ampliporus]|nr:hypothetical protein DFH29DRAFT_880523 [Suillus ampliporus]
MIPVLCVVYLPTWCVYLLTDTSSLSSSGSSTVFTDRGTTHDSINRELDTMSPVPEPAPVPVQDPSPPPKQATKPKKKKGSAYMHLYVTTDDLLVGAVMVSSKHSEAPPTEPKPINTVEPAREVTYNVLILPYAEIKKDNPTSLSDEDDYKELMKRLMKIKEPIVTIYAQELSDLKKALKASDINDEMKPVNRNITKLTDHGSHIPLSFPLLDCWVSAMEKGPEYATLEMPPNHSHFQYGTN